MRTTTILRLTAISLALLFVAASCGSEVETEIGVGDLDSDAGTTSTETEDQNDDPEDTADTADTAATDGVADDGEDDTAEDFEILINCDTEIDDDVPLFYATYFRCTDISVDGDFVVITGPDQPPHLSYYYGENHEQFVEFDYSRGDEYRPNPNEIEIRTFELRIPIDPTASGIVIDDNTVNLTVGDGTDYPMGAAGVALDGAAYFNSLAAPGDDIADERYTFDSNEGHPQNAGVYHYHAVAPGPLRVLMELGAATSDIPGAAEVELYGVMCDGTVLLGGTELDGSAAGVDLDAQGGHIHDLIDSDGAVLLENRYHIHMAPEIGSDPRGLSPEAQYYDTCNVA
jgi:YHYH protein